MRRILFTSFILASLLASGMAYAEETVDQLKAKIIEVQNKSELGIKNFNLCSNIVGYGSYTPIPGNKVKAGTKTLFYYEPINLTTNTLNNVYLVNFTQDILLNNDKGVEVFKSPEILKMNYQTRSPAMDFYATNNFNLGQLPPGTYQYKIVLHDKLKGKDATYTFPLEIVP